MYDIRVLVQRTEGNEKDLVYEASRVRKSCQPRGEMREMSIAVAG